jgi:hypothetical protein
VVDVAANMDFDGGQRVAELGRCGWLVVLTTDVGDRFGLDMRKTSEWRGAV